MKHFFTESIKNVNKNPDFSKTAQSNRKLTNSLSNKKTMTRKFK